MSTGEPTQRDVDIILRLWEMHNSPEMQSARMWAFAEFRANSYAEFQAQYPPGSIEWRRFTTVYGMFELYGVLISRNLLNEDLFFDLFGGIGLLWENLRPILPGLRAEIDPYLYENFELLHDRSELWKARHPPKGLTRPR